MSKGSEAQPVYSCILNFRQESEKDSRQPLPCPRLLLKPPWKFLALLQGAVIREPGAPGHPAELTCSWDLLGNPPTPPALGLREVTPLGWAIKRELLEVPD